VTTHVNDFEIVVQREDDAHEGINALKTRLEIKDLGSEGEH
jgi:hypothetical protein